MTAQTTTGRPRPRELRIKVGWTQQLLAGKLAHLAWIEQKPSSNSFQGIAGSTA